MNDAQTKTNKNNIMKDQYVISEDQEKDLQIHQLSNDLNNAKDDLKRLINSTPNIESLYKKLNEASDKNHSLECTISSLKTRVKQLQTKNNELKEQIQMNAKNNSILISKNENKIAQHFKELENFFLNLSEVAGKTFSSFDDVIQYVKSDNLYKNHNDSALGKLKEKNKKNKNIISKIKNEKNQIQDKLEQALRENEDLNIIIEKNSTVIDSFRQANQELEKKIESTTLFIDKLKLKNRRLKKSIKEITDQNFDINEPRIIQLQQFLQQKTNDYDNLNKQYTSLNIEKSELERQNAILCQKGREYLSFKQITQKEISKLKMTLINDCDERKLLMNKISRIELENVTLQSQVQSANQKCVLLTAQIQEMETENRNSQNEKKEFDGMIKIFEKVIESQKNDLLKAISIRNFLAERILKQNNLLSREEELLSKQIEQNKLLKTKLLKKEEANIENLYFFKPDNKNHFDQNSDYLLLGYIKELLLPEIPINFQSNLLSILDDSSLSIVQRIKQIFHFIVSNQFTQYRSQSFDIQNNQKIIDYLKIDTNSNIDINQISMTQEVAQFVTHLISTIEFNNKQLHQMTCDMKNIEEIIKNFGCEDINQIMKYFEHLKQKSQSTEEKLKEYRDIARVLKTELQKKLTYIDQIRIENTKNSELLKQEIAKLKSSEKNHKSRINQLKKEADEIRLKLLNSIKETEKEKQKLIDQKNKYDSIINKINANSNVDFSSTKLMIADIQKKYEMVEQRYQNELKLLKNQLEEQNKSKNELALRYQKQADETEQLMNELVKKVNDSGSKIEKLKKENSQLRLEKKALEFQLQVHSNHETCFATMLEEKI